MKAGVRSVACDFDWPLLTDRFPLISVCALHSAILSPLSIYVIPFSHPPINMYLHSCSLCADRCTSLPIPCRSHRLPCSDFLFRLASHNTSSSNLFLRMRVSLLHRARYVFGLTLPCGVRTFAGFPAQISTDTHGRFYFSVELTNWENFHTCLWGRGLNYFDTEITEMKTVQIDNMEKQFAAMKVHEAFQLNLGAIMIREEWKLAWDAAMEGEKEGLDSIVIIGQPGIGIHLSPFPSAQG